MNGHISNKRKEKRISQAALAAKAGVHRTTISRIERSTGGKPNWATLEDIASALGVSATMLVTGEEPATAPPITALPTIARIGLADFLLELEDFFEESDMKEDLLPRERWVQRFRWAMQKLLELHR